MLKQTIGMIASMCFAAAVQANIPSGSETSVDLENLEAIISSEWSDELPAEEEGLAVLEEEITEEEEVYIQMDTTG